VRKIRGGGNYASKYGIFHHGYLKIKYGRVKHCFCAFNSLSFPVPLISKPRTVNKIIYMKKNLYFPKVFTEINIIYNWGTFNTYIKISKQNITFTNIGRQLSLSCVGEVMQDDVCYKTSQDWDVYCGTRSKTALGPVVHFSFKWLPSSPYKYTMCP
jgi:hypothetical protein